MIKRLVLALPFAFAATAHALVTGTISVAILIAIVLAISVIVPARWAPGAVGHRLTSAGLPLVGLALGAALGGHAPSAFRITEAWSAIATGALLLASVRLLVRHAPFGYKANAVLGVVAMVACGQTRTGGAYAVAASAFLVSTLWAMRLDDDARAAWTALGARAKVASAAILVSAAAITAGLLTVLPRTHDWVQAKFDLLYSGYSRSGFSDRLHLGQMRRMLQSDEVVFRVRGPKPDYLRGAVFDFYYYGIWGLESKEEPHAVHTRQGPPPASDHATEVQRVSGANDRLFVPLDAHDAATPKGWARADDHRVFFRSPDDNGERVWFVVGGRDGAAPIAAPTRFDTKMVTAPGEEQRLRGLAEAWTAGTEGTRAKLEALALHLMSEYRYSLSYERDGPDAVLDFLFRHKEGHCEYFASAMALLARSIHIPARVVGGYRVAEKSPFGDYWIVRERHAHAWVEAWVDGAWVTFDPTPAADIPDDQPHEASLFAGVADALRIFRDEALDWIGRRSPGELVLLAAVMTALLMAVRWLRLRRRRAAGGSESAEGERALPCLDALLTALAARGARREQHEPLERFAERVEDARAAELLRRYAAHRYGGVGERAGLERDIEAHAARLRRTAGGAAATA